MAVIGLGTVGSAALETLAQRGLALHVAEVPGSQAGLASTGQARSAGIQPHWVWGPSWWTPWLPTCELCLLCLDDVDPTVALEVNARCLECRVPLLPGLVMGNVAQLGPVMALGQSPCLRCLDLRLRAVTGRTCLANFGPGEPNLCRAVGHALADRALRFLESSDRAMVRSVEYRWADGSTREHPVLRTWHCDHCAHVGFEAAARQPLPFPGDERGDPDPAHIISIADRLVDPVTGPVRSLEPAVLDPDDPPIHHWVAALADPGWAAYGQATVACGGNNLDDVRARAAALGEAVERMAACQPLAAAPMVAPYRDVEDTAVDPAAWDLFDRTTRMLPDFPFVEVSENEPISWVWGWSVSSGRAVLVPASRVFAPFRPCTPGDRSDHPPLGGWAAASTMTEAVLGAAIEVVERDAFMIAWANQLVLPHVPINPWVRDELSGYVSAFAARGVEVRCALLVLDHGVPVVIAMARGTRPGEPAITVAAGADLDPHEACRHALAELSANRLYVKALMAATDHLPTLESDEIRDQRAHALLYARPEMMGHIGHWWEAQSTVAVPAPRLQGSARDRLGLLLHQLAAVGLEVIAVDVTPPEIRDLGLAVAKVLVPGAYPMNFDSRFPHLGGPRLRTAPVVAGLLREPTPFESLSQTPHPFP